MIHLYFLPLSSDNQTAFADLAPGEAILIPSVDFIAALLVLEIQLASCCPHVSMTVTDPSSYDGNVPSSSHN